MARDPRWSSSARTSVEGGVFQATEGLQGEFGPSACSTPPSPRTDRRGGDRCRHARAAPGRRIPVRRLHRSCLDQIVNQAATVRWRSVGACGVPWSSGRRCAVTTAASTTRRVRGAYFHTRAEGRRPRDPARFPWPAQVRRSARRPGRVLRTQAELPAVPRGRPAETHPARRRPARPGGADPTIVTYGGVHPPAGADG